MQKFFKYSLPQEKIAQQPIALEKSRSDAKLLYARNGKDLNIKDYSVADLLKLLKEGDLLILNNARVLPVRFFVKLQGQTEIEIFLLKRTNSSGNDQEWEALARPMKKLRAGDIFSLSEHLQVKVLGRTEEGRKINLFLSPINTEKKIIEIIAEEGSMPIPTYIREGKALNYDRELYQTVFSSEIGSVAAPTAGLHFTEELLEQLDSKGVKKAFITLHLGWASFLPVENPDNHQMPYEDYIIPENTVLEINQAKARGSRVIVVGTTATRALESMAREENFSFGKTYSTNLFIKPGFEFKVVDLLFTNFHQPQSTHLLLVAAFFGEENIEKIYQHAINSDYRFLSYGDAMLLEKEDV